MQVAQLDLQRREFGKQRLALPAWVPLVGKDFFVVEAEMSTAQAVTPGQGQTVNIAGVEVGEIASVKLRDGKAIIGMRIRPKYSRLYKDASVLLRPKTGLNDMVLQSLDNGLLTITMNRPDRRNALNADMTRGLVEAARRAAEDYEVRAVLLKGAGGTFCVGGDVKSMAEGRAPLSFEAKMTNLRRGMEVSRILHQMSKPVVAQLDGAAAGA